MTKTEHYYLCRDCGTRVEPGDIHTHLELHGVNHVRGFRVLSAVRERFGARREEFDVHYGPVLLREVVQETLTSEQGGE